MDKYGTGQDPYTYPDSSILRNKLNISNENELNFAESQLVTLALQDIDFQPPPYNFSYLCALHFQLFGDVYDWAGQPRTIAISKQDTRFCQPEFIVREANKLFAQLEQENYLVELSFDAFCLKMAEFYIELNMIHPFREGNGRGQRLLFEHLAIFCGYNLSFKNITKEQWVQANILGCLKCDYSEMKDIMAKSLTAIKDLL